MFPKYLNDIPGALSLWRLGSAIKAACTDNSESSRRELERDYTRPVAWEYTANEFEIARHSNELILLDRVSENARFGRALELGCSEGVFTQQLADRCESLLATDLLPVAVDRARRRVSSSQVHFRVLDLRVDSLPRDLDLICLVHVLDYVRNPIRMKRIREKLVASLKLGGYLLLGTFDPSDQDFWWSPFMLRGGKRVVEYFGSHPELRILERRTLPYPGLEFIDALLQRSE